jgi:NADPH-dependent ferric siderophore reductase
MTGSHTIDPTMPFGAAAQAAVDATIDHLNDNHPDTVLLVARHLRPDAVDVVDAEIAMVDRLAATFVTRDRSQTSHEVQLLFPAPVVEAHEVQEHLLAALAGARAAADPAEPLTSLEREIQVTASLPTVHGRVVSVSRLAPNLLEVTLGGFVGYPLEGGDEFVYVMVSHEPGGISAGYGTDDYRDQAADDLVRGAYYTVRRSRPEVGEIDLWVVEHDHPGSVAAWMMQASSGDPVALWGPRRGFRVADDAMHVLLVADETGFAAVAAVLDALPADRRASVVLECVDADHRPVLPDHPGLEVIWVDRGDDAPGLRNRLLETVMSISIVVDAAFGAGESRQISAVRRHVRGVLGVPASRVLMTGYWRRPVA